MASTVTFPSDVGSEEVRLLRAQHNILITFIEALLAAVAASDVAGNLKTGVAAVSVAALRRLAAVRELPAPPAAVVPSAHTSA